VRGVNTLMLKTRNWYLRSKEAANPFATLGLAGALALGSPAALAAEGAPTSERSGGFTADGGFLETLKRHEGFRSTPYRDVDGMSVGYGFHLSRGGVDRLLSREGLSTQGLLSGRQKMTRAQAENLLKEDVADAVSAARKRFKGFDTFPRPAQEVLVNMLYNMGGGGLDGFKKMRAAVERGDWDTAADEMLDSDWAKQVKGRATELAEIMRSAGAESPSSGRREPTPPPSKPSAAEGDGAFVKVVRGDTLSGLAKKHLGDPSRWEEIAALNGIKNPSDIRPGQKLRLP
jgi:lysozyme